MAYASNVLHIPLHCKNASSLQGRSKVVNTLPWVPKRILLFVSQFCYQSELLVYSAFRCSIGHKSLIIGKISYNCDKILIEILRKLHFIYQNKISGKVASCAQRRRSVNVITNVGRPKLLLIRKNFEKWLTFKQVYWQTDLYSLFTITQTILTCKWKYQITVIDSMYQRYVEAAEHRRLYAEVFHQLHSFLSHLQIFTQLQIIYSDSVRSGSSYIVAVIYNSCDSALQTINRYVVIAMLLNAFK